jgi:hypothetical protein
VGMHIPSHPVWAGVGLLMVGIGVYHLGLAVSRLSRLRFSRPA